MITLPLFTCLIMVAVDESPPPPPPPSRDPFVQALTPPAAAAVNAQVVRAAAALTRITGAPAVEEPQKPGQPVSAPTTTVAPQPITLVLRGTAPDANGAWVALIEDSATKQTVVVRIGQSVNLGGRVAQVARIEHAMLLLQADGELLVFRQ